MFHIRHPKYTTSLSWCWYQALLMRCFAPYYYYYCYYPHHHHPCSCYSYHYQCYYYNCYWYCCCCCYSQNSLSLSLSREYVVLSLGLASLNQVHIGNNGRLEHTMIMREKTPNLYSHSSYKIIKLVSVSILSYTEKIPSISQTYICI